jgi:hypothetical protein
MEDIDELIASANSTGPIERAQDNTPHKSQTVIWVFIGGVILLTSFLLYYHREKDTNNGNGSKKLR